MSRHATRLTRAGLLERGEDPTDRRATVLVLATAGQQAVLLMRQRLTAAFDQYFATWPGEEARQFAARFRRFAEHGPF